MDLEQELQKILAASRSSAWQRAVATVRHYRWSQMMRRAVRLVGQRLNPHRTIGAATAASKASFRPISPEFRQLARIQIEAFGERSAAEQGQLDAGIVCLLHENREVGRPVDWRKAAGDHDASHLWRFQLQYHEFLLGHLASVGDSAWDLIWQTLDVWLQAFPPESTKVTADAWHPYCISRRVPVWCWLLVEGKPQDQLRNRLLQSLSMQCEYLSKNLEFELGGNHLLENVAALTIAAGLIDSQHASGWLSIAERVWRAEKRTQILPHGEHFERSPMYHCQVLGNLWQQAIAVQGLRPDLAAEWSSTASELQDFLEGVLHPDGEIPMFADSGFGEAPSIEHLRKLAAICPNSKSSVARTATPLAASSDTIMVGPYWTSQIARNGRETFIIVDCGEVGATELPAHAHADLATLEVSINRRRWIVDSGNFSYAAGTMRDYCRSSLGHNVLTIGGQNSCEVWGGFRMGRRGCIMSTHSANEQEFSWVQVGHNGYRHLGVSEIRRTVGIDRQGNVVVADLVQGATKLPAIGYLHLAPDVSVRPDDGSGREWVISCDGEERLLQFDGVDSVELADGWYCPAFGVRQPSTVIIYEQKKNTDSPLIWRLFHRDTDRKQFSAAIVQPLLRHAATQ